MSRDDKVNRALITDKSTGPRGQTLGNEFNVKIAIAKKLSRTICRYFIYLIQLHALYIAGVVIL